MEFNKDLKMADTDIPKSKETMKTGIELIADERQRQVSVEGWTPEHDAAHVEGELIRAAGHYIDDTFRLTCPDLLDTEKQITTEQSKASPPDTWPFEAAWWKPSENPISSLVKAGALVAAEIDRLQRKDGSDV